MLLIPELLHTVPRKTGPFSFAVCKVYAKNKTNTCLFCTDYDIAGGAGLMDLGGEKSTIRPN